MISRFVLKVYPQYAMTVKIGEYDKSYQKLRKDKRKLSLTLQRIIERLRK